MIGLGKYKEKYRPVMLGLPVLYFEAVPFLHRIKNWLKKIIFNSRKKK